MPICGSHRRYSIRRTVATRAFSQISQATHDTPHCHTPRGRAGGSRLPSQSLPVPLPAPGRTPLPSHAVCCRPHHKSPTSTPLLDPLRRLSLTNPAGVHTSSSFSPLQGHVYWFGG